jgi:hypothetical protein
MLDEEALSGGGKFYFAQDSRTTHQTYRRLDEWRKIRHRRGGGIFPSQLSRRLAL